MSQHIANTSSRSLCALIDAIPAPAALVEADRLRVNPSFAALTGYPPPDVASVAACFAKLFRGAAEDMRTAYDLDRQAGFPNVRLWQMSAADGTPRILEFRGRRLEGGELWLLHDVTERLIEAQLRQAQKLESLSVLAGGIAHDFNNLLTSILGYASLARMGLPAESPLQEYLAEVEKASRRAADLTRQMLAYSGQGKFVLGPVQLKQLVVDMVPFIQATLARRAALELDLPDGLPFVEGDEQQLRQVLLSLVSNAAEAMEQPPGNVRIALGLRQVERPERHAVLPTGKEAPGLYAFIQVADSGRGMDADTLYRMFDPFFSTKFIGRGLGMAAVLGIVRGHHGLIRVESEPGHGALVEALLPVSRQSLPANEAPKPVSARNRGAILVVDDEADLRMLAQHILEAEGYRVVTVPDGWSAEHCVRETSDIAAVLLDIAMPGRTGLETLQALRRLDPQLPIFLMSGQPLSEAGASAAAAAYNGFLQKPFGREDLLAFLKNRLPSAETL